VLVSKIEVQIILNGCAVFAVTSFAGHKTADDLMAAQYAAVVVSGLAKESERVQVLMNKWRIFGIAWAPSCTLDDHGLPYVVVLEQHHHHNECTGSRRNMKSVCVSG
jgi:hypothetical protein